MRSRWGSRSSTSGTRRSTPSGGSAGKTSTATDLRGGAGRANRGAPERSAFRGDRGSGLDGLHRDPRVRAPELVLDPVALEEPEPAPSVPLAREEIEVPIGVPVHRVRAGDHLRRGPREDRHPLGVRELGLRPGGARADVPVEADAVLEVAPDE